MPSEVSIAGADQDREPTFEELKRELAEAREQQAATTEILKVISRSPMDLQRVFAEIAASAARLCNAHDATIHQVDGDFLPVVAHHGPIPAPGTLPLTREGLAGRVVLDQQTIHVADLQAETDEYPAGSERARRLGFRTMVAAPLICADDAIGVIAIRRNEVHPFSDRQIALLETFANQAVIAIQNTRLFEEVQARTRELTEALEQQTAVSEVLRVISSSPGKLQPVFEATLKSAVGICDATFGQLFLFDGAEFRVVSTRNAPSPWAKFLRQKPSIAADPKVPIGRLVLTKQAVHVADITMEQAYIDGFPPLVALAQLGGARTLLVVPMLKEGSVIGAIGIFRQEVWPFTDKQIELVTTFADQAVIAIENARLLNELRESLQQQTATADVLKVISRSALDVQRVLDALVESAARLCDAYDAAIYQVFGDRLRLVAHHGKITFAGPVGQHTIPLVRGRIPGRTVIDRRTIHIADVLSEADQYPESRSRALQTGWRTALGVPLLHASEAIGVILIRRTEVRPFTQRQIELLNTFADQAVIAIENTRLFEAEQVRTKELMESLEYQTALADVLGIISRSPSNLQPVLDAIAGSARRLCAASDAVIERLEAGRFYNAAHSGTQMKGLVGLPLPLTRQFPGGRAVLDRKAVIIDDIGLVAESEYPDTLDLLKLNTIRSVAEVPLMSEGRPLGSLAILRAEVRPFTNKEVAMLESFASQAVIAIENARLFEAEQLSKRELQESLEYQTAISDVLGVISRSPSDLQPVLDVIVETAVRLCQADIADFRLLRDGLYHIAATTVNEPTRVKVLRDNPIAPDRSSVVGRVALERRTVHVPDIQADSEYNYAPGPSVPGMRAILGVPLLRDGEVIGAMVLFNVKPFTQKQIALVTTFANQALIAIENTRLFEEVQARNRDLRVALEQQTATSELLKVIGRSTFELQPVFDTLAENAVRLCSAERAFVHRFDGQFLRVVATHNVSPELKAFIQINPMAPGRYGVAARAALERRTVVIRDVQADPEITFAARGIEPVRTALSVPMLRADELLGVIMIYRHEVRPFTDSQVALIETFADQAVIAIENARLLEELQARNRDLTALGEVGRAVSSTLNLKVVLKAIVDRAIELSSTDAGSIFYYRSERGRFELGETVGLDEDTVASFRKLDITARQTGMGEAIAKREPLPIPDVLQRPRNALRDAALEAGLHAALIVPLLGSEGALGALVLQRRRTGEFPPTVVSLMQSFADQSAIALENARLFEEIAKKSRELEIASQHKSQFVANMSHELRTPLAAILGYAELMQEGFYEPQGPKSLDALTRIGSNGKHLLGLINTVLDIAKIESGQFTLNMAEYAIESVVETVRAATESLAQNKKLTLTTSVDKPIPVGLGDEQRLTQVLLNLVGNAIKFTDTGEVRVTAQAINDHFNVTVTDTGPGIPEEHQARIFEQFHQVDSSNTKAKGGTGLGLAIAKQIVEMHGGRIWVESTLGKGSTFQMQLPTRAEMRQRPA
jgi:GAF domain-containing protein